MKANGGRLPGTRPSGKAGSPVSLTRARIERTAELMRANGGKLPDRKPRGWAWLRNWRRNFAVAAAAARNRRYPYVVLCDCNGVEIVFGECADAAGGMSLNMAKLVPWAKNPRVELKL